MINIPIWLFIILAIVFMGMGAFLFTIIVVIIGSGKYEQGFYDRIEEKFEGDEEDD